jgi:hypothetical protein
VGGHLAERRPDRHLHARRPPAALVMWLVNGRRRTVRAAGTGIPCRAR